MSTAPVVLGVDLGTTATKVVAATSDAQVLHQTERDYPLHTDEPGAAVQDAGQVRDAAIAALAECVEWAATEGREVRALSFASAMHTLVGLDSAGEAVTPSFNWADTRAGEIARELRTGDRQAAAELHRATGTPVHTQSVMVKLAWLGRQRPDLTGSVRTWCALKDFVLAEFVGELVTEYSLQSGSGLQDMASLRWYEPALRFAGVEAAQLPEIWSPLDTLPLAERVAGATGLPAGLPVVLGGGDGPVANLGTGVVHPGTAALSLGTSGALRVTRDRPGVDERCRTFSYALADGLWVVGGAVSNGAVVGQWAADSFGLDVADLLDEALAVEPGADGLIALPYLLGERAPWWEPELTGSLVGLRYAHGRAELARALVEGVAQQLALVRDAVVDAGAQVRGVRATGGGFRSQVWSDAVAAALGTELELTEETGGSGLGAVLLGWRALGELDSLDRAAELIAPERSVSPDPAAVELMAARRPLVENLYAAIHELV